MKSDIIEFNKFKIKISKDVFTPREDVEIFPKLLKEVIKKKSNILELGTGTGAISIAIAKNFSDSKILATDINPAALKIALENAKLNNVDHIIKFKKSNWFSNIKNIKFDFIISNPPYLSKKNSLYYKDLQDPETSLYSENNGIEDIKKILVSGKNYLNENSYFLIEHSHNQTLILKEYASINNLKLVLSHKDILGFNRVSLFSN